MPFDITDDRVRHLTIGPDDKPVSATIIVQGAKVQQYLDALAAVEDGAPEPPAPPSPFDPHPLTAIWGPETSGMAPAADGFRLMVTGGYYRLGMTNDELLIAAHAKWAPHIPLWTIDMLRAQRYNESGENYQNQLGDAVDTATGDSIDEATAIALGFVRDPVTGHYFQSYGLMQCKCSPRIHPGTWPYAKDDPAWNLDYHCAYTAVAAKGLMDWLADENAAYRTYAAKIKAGGTPTLNEVYYTRGTWFSGNWADSAAKSYIAELKRNMTNRPYQAGINARVDPWGRSVA